MTQSFGASFFWPDDKESEMKIRVLHSAIQTGVYLLVTFSYFSSLVSIG